MEQDKILTEDERKQEFIRKYYEDEVLLSAATTDEQKKYIEYIEEGLTKHWVIALYAKAYGCYGGNDYFECDWIASRDCLLKIIELQGDKDPFIYNTLGYIYYYGRCNDKKPEYDLAFKYFSVGAANGVFESMYKTADMYIAGKGVPKSEKAGASIILGMYEDNKDIFCNEEPGCKFADVALRVGGLYERGCGVEQDYELAYYYYYEALYAITLRMEELDYYGDQKVYDSIVGSIKRVEAELPEDYFGISLSLPVPYLLGKLLSQSVGLDLELRKEKRDYYLVAQRYASEDLGKNVLINIPNVSYCLLTNSLKLKLKGFDDSEYVELPQKAFIDYISQGENDRTWIFGFRDLPLMEVCCDEFVFENDVRFE